MKNKQDLYFNSMIMKATTNNIDDLILEAKKKLNFTKYLEFIKKIQHKFEGKISCNISQIVNEIINCKRSIPVLYDCSQNKETIVVKEIISNIALLTLHTEKLQDFLNYRLGFEKSLFLGDKSSAFIYLQKIKQKFGVSFWSIESELLLLNECYSYSEFDNFYNKTKNECEIPYTKLIIRCLSKKISSKISCTETDNYIKSKRDRIKQEGHAYLAFFDLCTGTYFVPNYNDLLNLLYNALMFANNLNLIDLYILIDKITIYLLSNCNLTDLSRNKLLDTVAGLQFEFTCSFANKMADIREKEIGGLYHLFIKRKYSECLSQSNSALQNYSNDFEFILLRAKSMVLAGEYEFRNNLVDRITCLVTNILKKDIDYNSFLEFDNNSIKLIFQLSCTTMFYKYAVFYLDNCEFNKYIRNFSTIVRSGCCSNWSHSITITPNVKYDVITQKMYFLESCTEQELIVYKTSGFQALSDLENSIVKLRAVEKLYYNFIQLHKYADAIALFVDLQFESKLKVKNLDISFLNSLSPTEITRLYSNVDFCIMAHLTNYRGFNNNAYNHKVYSCLCTLLKKYNYDFPSNLQCAIKDSNRLIYLFRHAFTENLLYAYFRGKSFNALNAALSEKRKLLEVCKSLDREDEQIQIDTQIRTLDTKIENLVNNNIQKYVNTRFIPEEALRLDDCNIVMTLFCLIRSMKANEIAQIAEDSRIKDQIILYKKRFIENFDYQLSINIRHGYIKDRIMQFYSDESFYLLKIETGDETQNEQELVQMKKKQLQKTYGVNECNNIMELWSFCKELYGFIDQEIARIKISHSSSRQDDPFKIYIETSDIQALTSRIIQCKEPYEIENELYQYFVEFIKQKLVKIRSQIKKDINDACTTLYKKALTVHSISENSRPDYKTKVDALAIEISNWLNCLSGKELQYSFKQYVDRRKQDYGDALLVNLPNTSMNLDYEQMLCLTHIIDNLLLNAKEHNGSNIANNKIILKINLQQDFVEIKTQNDVGESEKIIESVETIEKLINCARKDKIAPMESQQIFKHGNGYKIILHELQEFTEDWDVRIDKEKLPKVFHVSVSFKWGGKV